MLYCTNIDIKQLLYAFLILSVIFFLYLKHLCFDPEGFVSRI